MQEDCDRFSTESQDSLEFDERNEEKTSLRTIIVKDENQSRLLKSLKEHFKGDNVIIKPSSIRPRPRSRVQPARNDPLGNTKQERIAGWIRKHSLVKETQIRELINRENSQESLPKIRVTKPKNAPLKKPAHAQKVYRSYSAGDIFNIDTSVSVKEDKLVPHPPPPQTKKPRARSVSLCGPSPRISRRVTSRMDEDIKYSLEVPNAKIPQKEFISQEQTTLKPLLAMSREMSSSAPDLSNLGFKQIADSKSDAKHSSFSDLKKERPLCELLPPMVLPSIYQTQLVIDEMKHVDRNNWRKPGERIDIDMSGLTRNLKDCRYLRVKPRKTNKFKV